MPATRGHKASNGFRGLDAAACADSCAVERGRCTREFELALQRPILKQSVDESRVKNIACSGGVHGVDAESGRVMELCSVPRQHAVVT